MYGAVRRRRQCGPGAEGTDSAMRGAVRQAEVSYVWGDPHADARWFVGGLHLSYQLGRNALSSTGSAEGVPFPRRAFFTAMESQHKPTGGLRTDDIRPSPRHVCRAVPYFVYLSSLSPVRVRQAHPQARPEEVTAALLAGATEGVVRDERMRPGTPNRLLYSRWDHPPPGRTGVGKVKGGDVGDQDLADIAVW
jgi:hypothetical protein